MNDKILWAIASLVTACLFCASTKNALGAMQQGGYSCKKFFAWLTRKDNLYFNRLAVLSLCLALVSAITAFCFSFLGVREALVCSCVPFFALCLLFLRSGEKYALKVPLRYTGRIKRLCAGYLLVMALAEFGWIAFLAFLAKWNGSEIYNLIAYVPFAVMPMFTPIALALAECVLGVFERARNKKFVKRAGQVLDERKIIRVGIVGSYGKTSVKNILKTLLAEKFAVVETPESFNTPMGIARTVLSPAFEGKEVFIAEMGARKAGDIAELCELVKPDFLIFTGICEQHIQGFGSLDGVWKAKSEALKGGFRKAVCGESLRERVERDFPDLRGRVVFGGLSDAVELCLRATETEFAFSFDGARIQACVPLLGKAAVENIALAVRLCLEMGMSAEEICRGLGALQPIAHRLQLLQANGAYILDDGYNCNPLGAREGIEALCRFEGRKCIVTPGIVECGVLEEKLNEELGEQIANARLDMVILVGDTLVGAVKTGYERAGGDMHVLRVAHTLEDAKTVLGEWIRSEDAVLFLNDLPDVY